MVELHPWTPLESLASEPNPKPVVKGDPIVRARRLQAMLDSGQAKNRADLAAQLGLSRARITQILKRLSDGN